MPLRSGRNGKLFCNVSPGARSETTIGALLPGMPVSSIRQFSGLSMRLVIVTGSSAAWPCTKFRFEAPLPAHFARVLEVLEKGGTR